MEKTRAELFFPPLRTIGTGAFSEVYTVLNGAGEILALKSLPKTKNPAEVVGGEINALVQAQNPDYVVRYYGLFENAVNYYLAMEYLSAHVPLTSVIADVKNGGVITSGDKEWTLRVSVRMILGLKHIHGSGVAHCDIKPDNIMVTPRGQVKYIDFGMAVINDTKPRFFGTPLYTAPELYDCDFHRGLVARQRADLWSLGVTLYELATGAKFVADYGKHHPDLPPLVGLRAIRPYMLKMAWGIIPGDDYTIPKDPILAGMVMGLVRGCPRDRRMPLHQTIS